MEASVATLWGFGLVLFRTTGLCLTAPLVSARSVPVRIRLALSLLLAFAVYSGSGAPLVPLPSTLWGLSAPAAAETLIGLMAGLSARWFLDAALAAGHLAGLSAGLGFSALVDPSTGAESTSLSQLFSAGAQSAALALGLHREAVSWLARSVVTWPPGGSLELGPLMARAVGQSVLAIALAVRLAFPVLGAVLLGHAAMGVTNRLAPQLNLANVGFSIALLAGGLGVYLAAPAIAELAARAAVAAFQG
jgi:flagellar biosynthesis protein FliR